MYNKSMKAAAAPPPPLRALEARYYTCPQNRELERERIDARTWQFAGHAAAIPNAGDFFAFELAGEPLFCVRDEGGRVRAFYNVCQHRAHAVVQGAGNTRKLLVCPYHGWTYNLDGTLAGAPKHAGGAAGIRLREARAELFHNFIFVNLDDNAAGMDEWFPMAREQLLEYAPNIAELAPLLWVEIPERCNWKVSVENHSECYHCPLNHRAFANGIIKPSSYDIQPQGRCLRHTTQCQNLDKMAYPIDLSANARAGSYGTWLLWPAFAFQVYPGNIVNTYHWRPHGVDSVSVWRGWHTPAGEESETIRALAKQDRETTVEEDIGLVESVQRGLQSRAYTPGPLVINPKGGVNSEHSVAALHQWTREAMEHGARPAAS